ncbi:WhiB family transcriptional regulator [Rhizohabitans arisaemae]|uniref:WhiB family transcriptional regulator n=1 Tax=Rhizohabitans arisaemae TaxID=2720610 RepID=UPI0024B098C5|nr:WhiB family transcriptional regulator [Rhizohabitans arisaemae]
MILYSSRPLTPSDAWSVLAKSGECRYDRDLHAGPDHSESKPERDARVQVAREVCDLCPVRALCLDYAMAVRPADGVWAGFTADEIGGFPGGLSEAA